MLIGVTGGIGTGKSTVAKQLARTLAAPLFDADQYCRELLEPGRDGYRQFVAATGSRYLEPTSDRLDRPRLRQALFADEHVRRLLEGILHPLVRTALRTVHDQRGDAVWIVAEVPLLFECGWQDDFDWVVCVEAPREVVISRVADRDKVGSDDIEQIIDSQLSVDEKRHLADTCIDNSSDRVSLERQVAELAAQLRIRFGNGLKKHGQR